MYPYIRFMLKFKAKYYRMHACMQTNLRKKYE